MDLKEILRRTVELLLFRSLAIKATVLLVFQNLFA